MKQFIKNRKNQNIAVLIEKRKNSKGLVVIEHGNSGNKEQQHIDVFANAFKNNNYDVLRFDATNSFGESDGNYIDATLTSFYQDLEDVIFWAKKQDFYKEPFALCGHSLGGISILLYAKNYPQEIKFLAPISSVVSGELLMEKFCSQEELQKWKEDGAREYLSGRGFIKRLKYGFVEDILNYNILDYVDKIIMPVLLIVGENDPSTPLEHQKLLFDKLPGEKELQIIKNAPHTFEEPNHLNEVYNILDKWIKKNN